MFSDNKEMQSPNRVLDFSERFSLERAAAATWHRYLPEYLDGKSIRERFIAVVKRFKAKYRKDPNNIRMKESDISFIYYCKSISDRRKQEKLDQTNIDKECLDQSLKTM